MDRPVALVTGASRGIGAALAVELARHGMHLVLTARTEGGLEETDDAVRTAGGTATLLPLDLLDGAAVDRIGPSLYERFGRLDVLAHVAGALGRLTPVPHVMPPDWDAALGVNLHATLRLIRTAAPLLHAAPSGRGVFVTDIRASEPRAYWGVYGASKAAMQHLVLAWADEVRTSALRINLFDPGPAATRLRATAMPGEDPATLPRPTDIAPALAALCTAAETRHGTVVRHAP